MNHSDCPRLTDIYNKFTGKTRSTTLWKHQWLNNDQPSTKYYSIIENATTNVVGGHGIIAYDLYSGGRKYTIGKTENTIIDQFFRGKFLYPAIEKKILKEYQRDFDILFTGITDPKKYSWRKNIGYNQEIIWNIEKSFIFSFAKKSKNYLQYCPTNLNNTSS